MHLICMQHYNISLTYMCKDEWNVEKRECEEMLNLIKLFQSFILLSHSLLHFMLAALNS